MLGRGDGRGMRKRDEKREKKRRRRRVEILYTEDIKIGFSSHRISSLAIIFSLLIIAPGCGPWRRV